MYIKYFIAFNDYKSNASVARRKTCFRESAGRCSGQVSWLVHQQVIPESRKRGQVSANAKESKSQVIPYVCFFISPSDYQS